MEAVCSAGRNLLLRSKRPSDEINQHVALVIPDNTYGYKWNRVKTIIDLEEGWFEILHREMYHEDMWAEAQEINIKHMPLSSFYVPKKREVDQILAAINAALKIGSVLVHCAHGTDRTGFIVATYRMRYYGWSQRQATDDMLKHGFNWKYFHWIQYVGVGK